MTEHPVSSNAACFNQHKPSVQATKRRAKPALLTFGTAADLASDGWLVHHSDIGNCSEGTDSACLQFEIVAITSFFGRYVPKVSIADRQQLKAGQSPGRMIRPIAAPGLCEWRPKLLFRGQGKYRAHPYRTKQRLAAANTALTGDYSALHKALGL